MINIPSIYSDIERERTRTYTRIGGGEIPHTMKYLSPSQRLTILVEEVGEIAELVKVYMEMKPRSPLSNLTSEGLSAKFREELIQVSAIAADWALQV